MSTGANPNYPAYVSDQNYGNTSYLFPFVGQKPETFNGKNYVVLPYTPIVPNPNPPGGGTQTNTVEVTVFGSSDGGVTWTELDTANRKAVQFTAGGATKPYGVVRSGSVFYVCLLGVSGMEIEQFDMASETWGAQVASGGPSPDDCSAGADGVLTAFSRIFPIRRSDGSFVVLYQGRILLFGQHFGRAYYTIWDGATWSSPVEVLGTLPSEFVRVGAAGAILGTADRVHLFAASDNTIHGAYVYQMFHRAVDSSNVAHTVQNIDSANKMGTIANTATVGTGILASSSVQFPWLHITGTGFGGTLQTAVATAASADVPAWTIEVPTLMASVSDFTYSPDVENPFIFAMSMVSTAQPVARVYVQFDWNLSGIGAENFYLQIPVGNYGADDSILFCWIWDSTSKDNDLIVMAPRAAGVWQNPIEIYRTVGTLVMCASTGETVIPPVTTGRVRYAGIGPPGLAGPRSGTRIRAGGVTIG